MMRHHRSVPIAILVVQTHCPVMTPSLLEEPNDDDETKQNSGITMTTTTTATTNSRSNHSRNDTEDDTEAAMAVPYSNTTTHPNYRNHSTDRFTSSSNTKNTNSHHHHHYHHHNRIPAQEQMNIVWEKVVLRQSPIQCDVYVEGELYDDAHSGNDEDDDDDDAPPLSSSSSHRTSDSRMNRTTWNSTSTNDAYVSHHHQQQQQPPIVHNNIRVWYQQTLFPCHTHRNIWTIRPPELLRSPRLLSNDDDDDHHHHIRISWTNCHFMVRSVEDPWWAFRNDTKLYDGDPNYTTTPNQSLLYLPILPIPNHFSFDRSDDHRSNYDRVDPIPMVRHVQLTMDVSRAKMMFTQRWMEQWKLTEATTTDHNATTTTTTATTIPEMTIGTTITAIESMEESIVSLSPYDPIGTTPMTLESSQEVSPPPQVWHDNVAVTTTAAAVTIQPPAAAEILPMDPLSVEHHPSHHVDIFAAAAATTIQPAAEMLPIDPLSKYHPPSHRDDVFATAAVTMQPAAEMLPMDPLSKDHHPSHRDDISEHVATMRIHHRKIVEQMMEQEMRDIHIILSSMCLATIFVIVLIGYMLQKQSTMIHRSKYIPTDKSETIPTSTTSSVKYGDTARTLSHVNNKKSKQYKYVVVATSTAAVSSKQDCNATGCCPDDVGNISPLSFGEDPIGLHNTKEHASSSSPLASNTMTTTNGVQPIISPNTKNNNGGSSSISLSSLSPCSKWWKNRIETRQNQRRCIHATSNTPRLRSSIQPTSMEEHMNADEMMEGDMWIHEQSHGLNRQRAIEHLNSKLHPSCTNNDSHSSTAKNSGFNSKNRQKQPHVPKDDDIGDMVTHTPTTIQPHTLRHFHPIPTTNQNHILPQSPDLPQPPTSPPMLSSYSRNIENQFQPLFLRELQSRIQQQESPTPLPNELSYPQSSPTIHESSRTTTYIKNNRTQATRRQIPPLSSWGTARNDKHVQVVTPHPPLPDAVQHSSSFIEEYW
jgi:hypothetical protein